MFRIIDDLRKKCEKDGNYTYANRFVKVFDRWSKDEQHRLLHNMRIAQQRELINIENAQRVQYQEFSSAWDKYMTDYESTAYDLVEQLKAKHQVELHDMQRYITEKFYNEHRWKKNIIELRKQE